MGGSPDQGVGVVGQGVVDVVSHLNSVIWVIRVEVVLLVVV